MLEGRAITPTGWPNYSGIRILLKSREISGSGSRWMEPCVESEGLLIECSEIASDQIGDEGHIPTMSRHRTRHDHEFSALQDRIAELLLTCAWGARP